MIRRFIGNLLNDALPKNRKRQIFIASFVALLKGVTTFDRELYEKLDRVLALSESTTEALAVPVMLSNVIWQGKTSNDVCGDDVSLGSFTTERINAVVGNLLKLMPGWLIYGSREEIQTDVAVILQDRFELLGV